MRSANQFNFESVTDKEIEDTLYQITAYADKLLAKRFNRLNSERKKKVTLILRERIAKSQNYDQPIDKFIVREIIEDANKNFYIYRGVIYK